MPSTTTPKTIDDVLTEVRYLLNDVGVAGSPFRFSQAVLLQLLNTALREVYTLRPDAVIGNFTQGILTYSSTTTYLLADLGTNIAFPFDERHFFAPVVAYVAGKAELADDEFVDTNRAMTLLQAFRVQLRGS
jgi:hypothetical protein